MRQPLLHKILALLEQCPLMGLFSCNILTFHCKHGHIKGVAFGDRDLMKGGLCFYLYFIFFMGRHVNVCFNVHHHVLQMAVGIRNLKTK